MKRGRPKEQVRYIRRAARRFLEGTRCRTPEEAVRIGVRTLEGWTEILRFEREASRVSVEAIPSEAPKGMTLERI
ncbi:MAG: hypothetical protein HC933_06485 [Pleurocapsa sp. SU_196_0]|nr:hypothetical protein [Pleurocapsa sp. SU_196_0]